MLPGFVHNAYMGKKPISRHRKPRRGLRRTFIKQWREHRGLSQQRLADRVAEYLREHGFADGYTRATLTRVENGEIAYTQPVLEAIADALGTDVASLLMRDPTDPEAIWSIWENAKQAERQDIEKYARYVSDRAKTGT